MNDHRRILALDVGSKRIGIAISDALGITAQPLPTHDRTSKRKDFAWLAALVKKHEVAEIVVGNPLRMSGEAGTQAVKIAAFVEDLRRHVTVPIHLWDERLTSAEAHRLLDESRLTRMERKGKVDQMAAGLILQTFLEARRSQRQ